MQLKTVVLPAPFGPMMAVISPRRAEKRKPVDGGKAAEAHGQMLDAQKLIAAHQPRPSLTKPAETVRASPSDADGVRPAISPRGRQSITTTMDSPKISMR